MSPRCRCTFDGLIEVSTRPGPYYQFFSGIGATMFSTRTSRSKVAMIFGLIALGVGAGCADSGTDSAAPSTNSSTVKSTVTTRVTPRTSAPVTRTPPAPLALGQDGQSATGSVSLYSVQSPVTGSELSERIRTDGKEFAVADLKVCPSSSSGFSASDFRLMASDSTAYTFWNVQVGAMDPNLTKSLFDPVVGVCTRGFLTFEVDPGKQLSQFVYAGSTSALVWQL